MMLSAEQKQRANKTYRNAEWLRQKYWSEGLSTLKIRDLCGLARGGESTILKYMRRHNIPRRTKSEANLGKERPWQRGAGNPAWAGGRGRAEGYVSLHKSLLPIREQELFGPMFSRQARVREHRLVMARHLGRPLESWEIVHHKNGLRDDNRIENLELFPKQAGHLARQRIKAEKLKWQRGFYRIVGLWLGERRKALMATGK